jgi:D-hexose-6-phosphate mutarotase
MYFFKRFRFLPFFGLLFLLHCATPSSTMLIDTWSDDAYQTSGFKNILIVGIARRQEVRESFELELKSHLKTKTVRVVISSEVMPPNEKIDSAAFHKYFGDENIDAVIVTRLLGVDELPSATSKGQQMDAATFYEYYENNFGDQADEMMDQQNLILKVETNVYETKKEKMIWTCVSKSFQNGKTARILSDLTKVIANALKEDGLIK